MTDTNTPPPRSYCRGRRPSQRYTGMVSDDYTCMFTVSEEISAIRNDDTIGCIAFVMTLVQRIQSQVPSLSCHRYEHDDGGDTSPSSCICVDRSSFKYYTVILQLLSYGKTPELTNKNHSKLEYIQKNKN